MVSWARLLAASCAAWPSAWGLTFALRSVSYAFNDVVLSLLDRPGGFAALRTFALRLAVGTSLLLALFVSTPAAGLWFETISGLSPALSHLAGQAMILSLFLPALGAFEMWFQGRLLHARRTRAITAGMGVNLLTACAAYAWGVAYSPLPGILFAVLGLTLASAAKTAWLAWSLRGARA